MPEGGFVKVEFYGGVVGDLAFEKEVCYCGEEAFALAGVERAEVLAAAAEEVEYVGVGCGDNGNVVAWERGHRCRLHWGAEDGRRGGGDTWGLCYRCLYVSNIGGGGIGCGSGSLGIFTESKVFQ